MKRLLLCLSAALFSLSTYAQGILPQINWVRATNAVQITGATGFHSVTHVIEGQMFDTVLGLMAQLNASIRATPTLDMVTAAGNTSTAGMIVSRPSYLSGVNSLHDIDRFVVNAHGNTGGFIYDHIGNNFFAQFVDNSSGKRVWLQAYYGTISNDHPIFFPDEDYGIGLGSTIVTHTTKDSIVVLNSGLGFRSRIEPALVTADDGTRHTVYAGSGYTCYNNSATIQYSFGFSAGTPIMMMKDGGSANYARLRSGSLSAIRDFYWPDQGGNISLEPKQNVQTAPYTLTNDDYGNTIIFKNTLLSTGILTVPSGLRTGFWCNVIAEGTANVTVAAGGGVTIHNAHGYTKSNGQYTMLTITNSDTANDYITQGDMQ